MSQSGIPAGAVASNALRYQYGRMKYHLLEAMKLSPLPGEAATLTLIGDCLGELLDDRFLMGGAESDALIVKGKKSKPRDGGGGAVVAEKGGES